MIAGRVNFTQLLTKEILFERYVSHRKSLDDIAKEYGCTRQMIYLLLKKYGIERRDKSTARMQAIRDGKFPRFNHHDIDESFFSQWSTEMAWVLGLLFTDGYINRSSISISSIDIDLLEKVRALLKTDRPVVRLLQSDKVHYIYNFEFYRKKIWYDLTRLGLTQRKSLTMPFPAVPVEYVRHFIRGCWDGDGSFNMSGGKLTASYVSGSKQFVEKLVEELFLVGVSCEVLQEDRFRSKKPEKYYLDIWRELPLAIYESPRSKSPCYSIKTDLFGNLVRLFRWFYDDVPESCYLGRKYELMKANIPPSEVLLEKHSPWWVNRQEQLSNFQAIKEAESNAPVPSP